MMFKCMDADRIRTIFPHTDERVQVEFDCAMDVNDTVQCPGQCDMDILCLLLKNDLDVFCSLWGRQ